jgi:SET domain-containing protein
MILSPKKIEDLAKTELLNYFFGEGGGFDLPAIILGYGSLYNHSYSPNAKFTKNSGEKILRFVATRDIKKGEEILINYKGESKNDHPLWFE